MTDPQFANAPCGNATNPLPLGGMTDPQFANAPCGNATNPLPLGEGGAKRRVRVWRFHPHPDFSKKY